MLRIYREKPTHPSVLYFACDICREKEKADGKIIKKRYLVGGILRGGRRIAMEWFVIRHTPLI